MIIALAQLAPKPGDLVANLDHHKRFVQAAHAQHANLIVFPELSLTGYEPTLAHTLATSADDPQFNDFQELSNQTGMIIAAGMPVQSPTGIGIGLLIWQPGKARAVYCKRYLHPDEEPFFVPGTTSIDITIGGVTLSFAICYELSVQAHALAAHQRGASVYVASVAKYARGIEQAHPRLADIARTYGMTVLMVNSVGEADGGICAGQSGIWQANGNALAQLNDVQEALLILDTTTQQVTALSL